MKKSVCFSFVAVSMLASGCMTVTRGTSDEIMVVSKPVGAYVSAELLKLGKDDQLISAEQDKTYSCEPTPCSVGIPRSKHARFTVEKEGYQPIKFLVISKGSAPNSSIRAGTIVAGAPPNSYVIAGKPEDMTRFLSGNSMVAIQTLTFFGAVGGVMDKMSGANRSFAPNPVTAILAPIENGKTVEKNGGQNEHK